MLKPITIRLIISFLLFNLSHGNLYGETAERDPDASFPIAIEADSAEFDNKKGTATYHGHVVMKQGTRHLSSETLIITKNTDGKIKSLLATGNPAHLSAQPNPEKPKTAGKANTIEFYPSENKFILTGSAQLTQNENLIQGSKLTYNLTTKVLVAESNRNERTTVILPSRNRRPNP
jgi:lipopolysaccharide export system protein LptA